MQFGIPILVDFRCDASVKIFLSLDSMIIHSNYVRIGRFASYDD